MSVFKRILNRPEELTHERLRDCCARNGAQIFAKIRLADVLPIENSGISDDLFRFALQSHFDFVVCGGEMIPLFGIEFDGPSHSKPQQRVRDSKKDQLSEWFDFGLLRINSEYINRTYRKLHLLTWFVECWFANGAISDAQKSGHLPLDDCFDPQSVVVISGLADRFPLWLSAEPLAAIRKFAQVGKCIDCVPSYVIGFDENRTYHGIAYLAVDDHRGVLTSTAMRCQRFPVPESDAIFEILMFQIRDLLQDVIDGSETGKPLAEIERTIKAFRGYVTPARSGGISRGRSSGDA